MAGMTNSTAGFVPPPYPQAQLGSLRSLAEAAPGGLVDTSVGTPVDPIPEVARRALVEALPSSSGYPTSIGSPEFRQAAADWMARRLSATVNPTDVTACVGTKEAVASLAYYLALRSPGRDTVLYPELAYPTYAMGATLAGLRAQPVPVDENWCIDLSRIDPADARRALVLWLNDPANPTGACASASAMANAVAWAQQRGIVVASDECYAEFTFTAAGAPAPPVTALAGDHTGVLAVHSLSKRSNLAGLRVGFMAGDPDLVSYLGEVRRHAGLMVAAPNQAAAAAALADDAHVDEQRSRYQHRRAVMTPALESFGLVSDGGPSTFYLWLTDPADPSTNGWAIAERLARTGLLVAPGDLYGAAGAKHVRLALSITDEQTELAASRLRQ
ncbi:succinyldiaminopimelate transaminase [Actinomycetes bacterium]|nr:succinyldiaminopimelate transaminase [Actinomycetes bacterium]